jgi:type IV secretion system protein VirB4
LTNNAMKVLVRSQTERDVGRLDQRVKTFVRQLNDLMRIEVHDQQGRLRPFRRLLNYDDWRIAGTPQNTQFLDYQVVNSNIEAERDHLRVGDHNVRVLTMKEVIGETRPVVLDQLFKIPGEFLCSHRVDASRNEQGAQGDIEGTPAFQHHQDRVHLADRQ